jgi:hypothetical protein
MRSLQFWILLLGSTFVSLFYFKQIFLARDLNQEQRILLDSQEVISQGNSYESMWKQLALRVFQASRQDPELADVLKKENVQVRAAPPGAMGSSDATIPASATPVSSKAPVTPAHSNP